MRYFAALGLAFALLTAAANAQVKTISAVDLQQARSSSDWLMYGHDYSNDRYAALDQINTSNVAGLVPAFVFQTAVAQPFETTPVVVDGKMYVTTAYDHVFAIDAKSGKRLWQYQPKLGTTIFCCGPVNRGVAIAGGLVYLGQLDGKLVALDQATGKIKWSVQAGDNAGGYSLTMAPLIYKNMVLVGGAGGEYGIRGSLSAFAQTDGKLVWRWYSTDAQHWAGKFTPTTADGADLHRDISAEKAAYPKYADAWKRGGGEVWMTPAVDPAMNTIFVSTGNPSPDLYGAIRPGDNLYTDSMVAIDASNGKLKWYYQEVPHDVWDLDAVSPPVLIDAVDGSGKSVEAVAQAGKTGWLYIVDRRTGKLIRKSQNFVPQESMFAQPTTKGTRMLPGANGGAEWSPTSYDPKLHYVFVSALHQPMLYYTKPQELQPGALWLGSAFVGIPTEQQYGLISAIDVNSGAVAWQDKVDYPLLGGTVSTSGGLTFVGEGNGNFDAIDSKTGRILWQFQTGAGVNAAPMVYQIDGEEYVAVASGGSFQIGTAYGDSLYIFHLPKH
ncbi:MAG: pyrroloquinoline quinone-dependent dehydrogenase [Vulcanimicrobiaceae bacterium]